MLASIMAAPAQTGKRAYVLGSLSFLMGAAILYFSTGSFLTDRAFMARAIHVSGTVTWMVKNTDSRDWGHPKYPQVTFKALDGRVIRHTDRRDGSDYETGKQVTVLYDPQNPLNARIAPMDKGWSIYLISWFFGVVFLGVGIFFLIVPEPAARVRSSRVRH